MLYFSYTADINQDWQFYTDVDFAAAPQGRAIDLAMRARYKVNDQSKLGLGIRSLEGGADNEKVFSFSWFNYFVLEYNYSF